MVETGWAKALDLKKADPIYDPQRLSKLGHDRSEPPAVEQAPRADLS